VIWLLWVVFVGVWILFGCLFMILLWLLVRMLMLLIVVVLVR